MSDEIEFKDKVSAWLVLPILILGFVWYDIVILVIGFVMLMVGTTVESTAVRRSILVGINAIFFCLFVAAWIDLDAEPQHQELIRIENAAKYKLRNFPPEVSVAWRDEGFEIGHMMAERRRFYVGMLGGPRNPHIPDGDLPCFEIYDTQVEKLNVRKLPDPGIPFAMEISGGGVRKLSFKELEPLITRFRNNLKWLRLSGDLDDTVLYWLITQKDFDVSAEGHERRIDYVRQRYGIRR